VRPLAPRDFTVLGTDRDELLRWLRSNSTRFFSSAGPTLWALAGGLVEGALVLGCRRVEVELVSSWTVVASDCDWVNLPSRVPAPEEHLFSRLFAFPEKGDNCHRAEVLVAAIARDIVTCKGSEVTHVQGEVCSAALLSYFQTKCWSRAIAFRHIAA